MRDAIRNDRVNASDFWMCEYSMQYHNDELSWIVGIMRIDFHFVGYF